MSLPGSPFNGHHPNHLPASDIGGHSTGCSPQLPHNGSDYRLSGRYGGSCGPFSRRSSAASGSQYSYSIRAAQKQRRRTAQMQQKNAANFIHNQSTLSLPYMDDSLAATSSLCSLDETANVNINGGFKGDNGGSSIFNHSRQNSYCSHASRVTYNSHAELTYRQTFSYR